MALRSRKCFLIFMLMAVLGLQEEGVRAKPQVPCYFIFGDSLADNGNNNDLPTKARSNYRPYGIDFPGGPTGRFTNGKTAFDILGELLGFDSHIPPFATAWGPEIVKGVNYASASAGIRKETGLHLGVNINFDRQLDNHAITVGSIRRMMGFEGSFMASRYLSKCLYTVGMGNNDYINNYFMPRHYPSSKLYTPKQYAEALIGQYSLQLERLYRYGARKVALIGVGIIGCVPFEVANNKTEGRPCLDSMNIAALMFNEKLKSLVDRLNNALPDAKFIFIDSFAISAAKSAPTAFTVANTGCCAVNDIGQCKSNTLPCPDRSEFVFWDSFHPTEAANEATAARYYRSSEETDAYPYDISHLVKL